MIKRFFGACAVSLIAASTAFAGEYTVDQSHSNVMFTIRHLVSKVSGQFKDFEGNFNFDDKKPEMSSVKFSINAASIDTQNSRRDEHLKGADFFDVTKFPKLTFTSTKVTKESEGRYKLEGNMSLHGVTKPVSYDVEYLGADKDPKGTKRAGFVAKTRISRKDFGLTWTKTVESGGLLVGDEVEITLQLEAMEKETTAKK